MNKFFKTFLINCLFRWSFSLDTKNNGLGGWSSINNLNKYKMSAVIPSPIDFTNEVNELLPRGKTPDYMYESCNSSSSLDTSFQLETSKSLSYPFRIDCSFSITAPVGSKILAVITRFELEEKLNGKCADYLNIHDGVVKSAALLNPSPLCGSSILKTFNSSGSSMTFHFHSDRSAAYRGFSIILTAYENGPCTSSQLSCNNGMCIDPVLKCDDYNQCGDNSDESSCQATTPAASAGSIGMALVLGIIIGIIIVGVIVGAILLHVYKKNQWKNFIHQQLEDPDVWNSSPSYPVTKKYYRNGKGNYNTLNNETTEESSNGACCDRDESTENGHIDTKTPH